MKIPRSCVGLSFANNNNNNNNNISINVIIIGTARSFFKHHTLAHKMVNSSFSQLGRSAKIETLSKLFDF